MPSQSSQDTPLHKIPPQNLEAEKSVLGGILLDNTAINRVLEVLGGNGEDFYRDAHKKIFRTMVALLEKDTAIDVITLTDALKTAGLIDPIGGASYIAALADSVPTAANITYYARIVREKAVLRRLITAATDIVTRGFDGGENVDEFLDDAERIILQASEDKIKQSFYHIDELLKDTFKVIEKLYEKKEHITGVATGFAEFDKMTAGLQPSDLIIVAGRPSMGKTSFCLNVAQYAAVESKLPVAIFSLEMSKEQLVLRMLSSVAKVDSSDLRKGFLGEKDWPKLTRAAGVLSDSPIYIDDTPAMTVLEMRAKARRLRIEKGGLGLVIVDYLQLMRGRGTADNRQQEISEISRSLKAMAKELNVPVVALSQLSRNPERREKNRPQLADLRESGALEQDADVVVFIFREELYKPCECPKDLSCTCGRRGVADILIEKQRNGPTGDIKLVFLNKFTTFANLEHAHIDYGAIA
ncbi:MAG: replicative DNA helicase [Deltaproteobacteria bacterium GWC2_42_11]|nr:MAG: replicative DNA helicase [Deltaproteobacteria bacterium GWC2_42_11]HBO84646.1 replicative DNA helicase [Deltaproteobacteria bacterium]